MNKYVLSIRDILMCTTVHVVIQLKTVHFKFQTWDTFEELATLKINWPFNLYMFRIDYLICFTFFTLIYLFEINSFFLFSGNWKPFQCSQGCTTFETRTGSSQIGSILRIRSRHANPVTLLLYARSSLVGLYMVRNSSNLHV